MPKTGNPYDTQNVFAKILRAEIPAKVFLETLHTLVFEDISPRAPHHYLAIPKGAYVNYDHFVREASDGEIIDFHRTVGEVIEKLGVAPGDGGAGYRVISNAGEHGMQEVPHLHIHIIAGRAMAEPFVSFQ